jgi:transposase
MLLTEIGPDLSRFPTAAAFCSWLRLCPEPKISGGKILSSKTRPTKNRAALALRMAAQGLHRSQTFLGDYFRRMKARLGTPKAMTAAAHKLARIVYHMITTHQEYDSTVFQELERRVQDRKRMKLRAQARAHLASNSSRGRLFLSRLRKNDGATYNAVQASRFV